MLHCANLFLLLLRAASLARSQWTMRHFRVVDGVEVAIGRDSVHHVGNDRAPTADRANFTIRWDGSPAMNEW